MLNANTPNIILFRGLFLLIFLPIFSFSQNLIPNPSFEDVNTCKKYHELCAPKGWRSATLKNFYYTEYLPGVKGAVKPIDGNRSIAFTLYYSGKNYERKFVQAALKCELKKGQTYRLKLHYLIKEAAIEEFGVHFAQELKVGTNYQRFQKIKPQIRIKTNKALAPWNWASFETNYTAQGGEKGIIIGNFNLDETTIVYPPKGVSKKVFKSEKEKRIYYRFDQISLIPLDSLTHKDCPIEENLDFIYKDSIRHILENPLTIDQKIKELPEKVVIELPPPSPPKETFLIGEDSIQTNQSFSLANINFETNSARLLPSSYRDLEQIAEILKNKRSLKLQIIGHTDNVGSGHFNQVLSEQRAATVGLFLIRQGIQKNRLRMKGMGEAMPIQSNQSEKGRLMNRRVEFVLEE